jgi:hypothetical protein
MNDFFDFNDTHARLKYEVDIFLEDRNVILPKIERLTKENQDQTTLLANLLDFDKRFEHNDDTRNFISALNTAPNFERYKYRIKNRYEIWEVFQYSYTERIIRMYEDSMRGGGSLMVSLTAMSQRYITTPSIAH